MPAESVLHLQQPLIASLGRHIKSGHRGFLAVVRLWQQFPCVILMPQDLPTGSCETTHVWRFARNVFFDLLPGVQPSKFDSLWSCLFTPLQRHLMVAVANSATCWNYLAPEMKLTFLTTIPVKLHLGIAGIADMHDLIWLFATMCGLLHIIRL